MKIHKEISQGRTNEESQGTTTRKINEEPLGRTKGTREGQQNNYMDVSSKERQQGRR